MKKNSFTTPQKMYVQFVLTEGAIVLAIFSICLLLISLRVLTAEHAFIISAAFTLITELSVAPFLLKKFMKPIKEITEVANGATEVPATGNPELDQLLQTIHRLVSASHAEKTAAPTTTPVFQTLIQSLPVGVIALDNTGKVLYANGLAPVVPNIHNEPTLELSFDEHNNLTSWLEDARANKIRDTHQWRRIANKIPGESDRRIFDVIGYYSKNPQPGVESILVTIDKTSEYAPDDESMDFIALAAHELRGPITVIRGYLDILNDELGDKLAADQQILIDRLAVSASQLSGYVNNILNVSRYDRHHLILHLHEERLIDIIKNLVPDLALRAKTQHRVLSFVIPPDLPTIAADPISLSEVLNNLIDNALKYSHENGKIIITAKVNEQFVEISVQDFGIGMPESVMGNLFTKFYRSHISRQSVSGTGLGLYICKAIVQSHGGDIYARSVEGEGTTVGFTIPIYSSVADKLAANNNSNQEIIQRADGWIKNHAMFRR